MAFELAVDPRLVALAATLAIIFLILYATFAAFSLVGITAGEVIVLLFVAPLVAFINVPVTERPGVVIGVNAAGVVIPVIISLRFVLQDRLPVSKALAGIAAVTLVAYWFARLDPETGILVPLLPVVGASLVVGLLLAANRREQVGPTTYASGALGTLIGADLLHLGELDDPARAETLFAVIGGAGTYDAIYLMALVAVFGAIIAVAVARVMGGMKS